MATMTDSCSRAARCTAWIAIIAGALSFGACSDFDVVNTNAPTSEELTSSPTRAVLARAATGIFAQALNDVGTEIVFYAIYGREGYNLLGNDPREADEQVRGPRDPSGRNSGLWLGPYSAIRTINTYLAALPNASGLTPEEVRASAGFAKTMKAWHLHRLAVRSGEYGIPIDVDRPIDAEPAPFVSFSAALEAVSALLDEAYADLRAGGSTFPFPVAPGYAGFSTPATFALFNRALAAKVLVHRATFVDCTSCWAEASAALDASFVTDVGLPASLATGVYYAFSSAANEAFNPISENLSSERLWVHPSIISGAQTRTDGSPDLRLTRKVMDANRTRTLEGLTGTHKPVLYNHPTTRRRRTSTRTSRGSTTRSSCSCGRRSAGTRATGPAPSATSISAASTQAGSGRAASQQPARMTNSSPSCSTTGHTLSCGGTARAGSTPGATTG